MRWRESLNPVPMTRLAVVAATAGLRDALVRVAHAGTVEFDRIVPAAELAPTEVSRALHRLAPDAAVTARLSAQVPDIAELERTGRVDLLLGEAQLAEQSAQALVRGEVAAMTGWAPAATVPALAENLARVGAAAVVLPRPAGVDPPTAAADGTAHRSFAPLVQTYATVPYADLDPTVIAGLAYVVMFGAMFGDVGHGALLVLAAALIRAGRLGPLARLRPHWLLVFGAGVASMVFGFAYGECFGPTGLVPAGILAPMEQPVAMLVAGVAGGAVLLGGAFALGTLNRVREGGWALALYAPAGVAGAMVFVAAGFGVAAVYWHNGWLGLLAATLATAGLVLAFVGFLVGAGGGASGALQAGIEVVDLVIRLGANVVSFARLAAFGLTHAVLGWIIWTATTGLWQRGAAGAVAATLVFIVGNALTFGLEALVAAIQALRLEYYELFSRVFQIEGRPFRPWHIPIAEEPEEASCRPGCSPAPHSSWAWSSR